MIPQVLLRLHASTNSYLQLDFTQTCRWLAYKNTYSTLIVHLSWCGTKQWQTVYLFSVQLATMFVQLGRPVCNTRVASSTRNTTWTGCHCTHQYHWHLTGFRLGDRKEPHRPIRYMSGFKLCNSQISIRWQLNFTANYCRCVCMLTDTMSRLAAVHRVNVGPLNGECKHSDVCCKVFQPLGTTWEAMLKTKSEPSVSRDGA